MPTESAMTNLYKSPSGIHPISAQVGGFLKSASALILHPPSQFTPLIYLPVNIDRLKHLQQQAQPSATHLGIDRCDQSPGNYHHGGFRCFRFVPYPAEGLVGPEHQHQETKVVASIRNGAVHYDLERQSECSCNTAGPESNRVANQGRLRLRLAARLGPQIYVAATVSVIRVRRRGPARLFLIVAGQPARCL